MRVNLDRADSAREKLIVTLEEEDRSTSSSAFQSIHVKGVECSKLMISFHRTIRVPDNKHTSELPPGCRTFPIYAGERGPCNPIYRKLQHVSGGQTLLTLKLQNLRLYRLRSIPLTPSQSVSTLVVLTQ